MSIVLNVFWVLLSESMVLGPGQHHMMSKQVGAISKMPGLQSFCVGTAVGLAAIFLIQARMIIIIIVIIMIIVNMI